LVQLEWWRSEIFGVVITDCSFARFLAGEWLERLFQEQLAATGKYSVIGNYWEPSNKNEIDIVVR